MSWKDSFGKGKELVLATASKRGVPCAAVVASLGLHDGKLLVADCQMNTTRKNLDQNADVCVVSGYLRVKGTAKIETAGKFFDLAAGNDDGYEVKAAVVITIEEVFDLDEHRRLL